MVWLVKGAEDERRRMKVGSMCLVLGRPGRGTVTSRTVALESKVRASTPDQGPGDLSHVIARELRISVH
jgi:hypothetical protein